MPFISQIWIPTGSQLLFKNDPSITPFKQGKVYLINNLNETHMPKFTHKGPKGASYTKAVACGKHLSHYSSPGTLPWDTNAIQPKQVS